MVGRVHWVNGVDGIHLAAVGSQYSRDHCLVTSYWNRADSILLTPVICQVHILTGGHWGQRVDRVQLGAPHLLSSAWIHGEHVALDSDLVSFLSTENTHNKQVIQVR